MNNFFKNINSDCLIHISMYFDKEELKKINLIDTYLKSFFEDNSNIIFYKVIKILLEPTIFYPYLKIKNHHRGQIDFLKLDLERMIFGIG